MEQTYKAYTLVLLKRSAAVQLNCWRNLCHIRPIAPRSICNAITRQRRHRFAMPCQRICCFLGGKIDSPGWRQNNYFQFNKALSYVRSLAPAIERASRLAKTERSCEPGLELKSLQRPDPARYSCLSNLHAADRTVDCRRVVALL